MIRRMLQVATWMLALAVVVLPVVAVLNGWIGSERWPLRTLRVNQDLQRVAPGLLRETVLPYVGSGFFAVRLGDARAAIEALPWVESVEVRKRWPDVLEVRIEEHDPFARWGDERLLSVQGKLFPATGIDIPAGLPLLDGPDARTADVVALYNESASLFATIGVGVNSVVLDSRGSWSLALDNGIDIVVGSHEARLRLRRFARMLPQLLGSRSEPLLRADLRYTNGFALEWAKPGTGNRESGVGEAAPSLAGNSSTPRIPAFANHPSPITNTGSPS